MRKIFFIIVVSAIHLGIAQQEEFIHIGGKGFDGIYDAKISNSNEIYVTGFFQGRVEGLKSKGNFDAFIAKYDTNKTLKWIRQIGSEYRNKNIIAEYGKHIALDSKENVYVSGLFCDEASFDKEKIKASGKQDAFIAKYDTNGNSLWTKTLGSKTSESVDAMFVDTRNNLYLVGRTNGVLNIDINKKPDNTPKSFIIKYSTNGEQEWFSRLQLNNNRVLDVVHDTNAIYILAKAKISSKKIENYLLKYSLDGKTVYQKKLSETFKSNAVSIDIDKNGAIYLLSSLVDHKQLQSKYSISRIDSKGVLTKVKDFTSSFLFKPKKLVVDKDGFDILGAFSQYNFEKNKVSLDSNEGSVIVHHDLTKSKSASKDPYVISNHHQNKVFDHIIKEDVMISVGQFYKSTEVNGVELISNGRTDGFVSITPLIKTRDNIKEQLIDHTVVIYPNPNDGVFFIKNAEEVSRIQILDLTGRLLIDKQINGSNEIEVRDLQAATYGLVIYRNDNSVDKIKLVIE